MEIKNYETMDPNMLLSIVNMKLRDEFNTLDDLVKSNNIVKEKLEKRLDDIGYDYCEDLNQFKVK